MRIAVDASILELPCPTGVERAARELLRALPAVLEPGDELIVMARGKLAIGDDTVAVRSLGLGGGEPLAVWRESRLGPALAHQGAHVCWSPVTAIALRTDVPRVATVHEVPWLVRPALEGALRQRLHGVRLRVAVASAARIVCPSESTVAQVARLHGSARDRLRVVPHGVGERFLAPGDDVAAAALRASRQLPPGPYLLHVGGTRARKNVPLLLRAYARYRLRGGESVLVLAGPGRAPARMPGALHLGYVSDDLLLALYDGASALVVSSESEGFGLPVLEAMARSVPVVATRCGGVEEAAGGAALLVDALDDEALADAMLRVEREGDLRRTLLELGRARLAGATWAGSAARLREVLAEAVGRP